MSSLLYILMCWNIVLGLEDNAEALTINFENVRHPEGTILIGFYTNKESWEKRTPAFEIVIPKSEMIDGKVSTVIKNLNSGVYGIAVLDDSNNNNIVDMGWIFPKEGFGFSDYYHQSFRFPRFEDFDFDFPQRKSVVIRMRYL